MASPVVQKKPKQDSASADKPAVQRSLLPPLTLPKHLKPLTGPTGMRRAY